MSIFEGWGAPFIGHRGGGLGLIRSPWLMAMVGARLIASKVLAGQSESLEEIWKLAASSGWLGEV